MKVVRKIFYIVLIIALAVFSVACNQKVKTIAGTVIEEDAVTTSGIEKLSETSRPKPNIVLLLADDLGWQDVGCYDIDAPSPYETPNIDALAKKGVKFWQGYSPAPTCAPSRCAIMSGNHPARAQKTHVRGGTPPTPYHKYSWRLMAPWYSGRLPVDELTIAKFLQQNGYKTGHTGKWHMSHKHFTDPRPAAAGFDYSSSEKGVVARMKPDRLSDFATTDPSDPFRLDENGFAFHQSSEDALKFLRQEKDNPFFLYYSEHLVHTPIHTRTKRLLEKYLDKLGIDYPTKAKGWELEGQNNPFYCAMVETLDYHYGKIVNYLNSTDDPRWPGHKLIDNTYIILTSDNGGMEKMPNEIITDNYPLDRGKISAMEGGTRVPLIITGPNIEQGIESDVMINGLDFYPTILSWIGAPIPQGKNLDGLDISTLLKEDPTNPELVKTKEGKPRETMMWHFPNSVALESTIRVGDYKLIRNYNHEAKTQTVPLELYQLYNTENGKATRVDIEESYNLVETKPVLAERLDNQLTEMLTEMKASYPYNNPHYNKNIPHEEKIPVVTDNKTQGDKVTFTFKENGAQVIKANLMYTLNGGTKGEEWFRLPATLASKTTATATLPEGTSHYLINLIDENNFLVSYPELLGIREYEKIKKQYSDDALVVTK